MKNLVEYTDDGSYKEWALFRINGCWRILIIWDKNIDWGWKLDRGGSVEGFTAGHLIIGW
jgi:hypothetical protein